MATKPTAFDKNIRQLIATNQKAYYDYTIEETLEAGIVLQGSEVKSLRQARVNLVDAHAMVDSGEVFIHNLHIDEYTQANLFGHYPKRPKKLLLRRQQIRKLIGLFKKKNVALIPLKIFFNHRNLVKVVLSIATGKKKHDKRAAIKERDWERSKARVMRGDL